MRISLIVLGFSLLVYQELIHPRLFQNYFRIEVQRLSDGSIGSLPEWDFDSKKYKKLYMGKSPEGRLVGSPDNITWYYLDENGR